MLQRQQLVAGHRHQRPDLTFDGTYSNFTLTGGGGKRAGAWL